MNYLKQTIKYILRNLGLSIATIVVITITFLIGLFFILIVLFIQDFVVYFERQPHLIVLYEPKTPEEHILKFKSALENSNAVLSIEYVSPKKALNQYITTFNEDISDETLQADKFPANLRIKLSDIQNIDEVYSLIKQEKEINGKIREVIFYEDVIDTLKIITNYVQIGGIAIIIFLSTISIVLILITIGFNISKYCTEIEIMQLIGASPLTVILPFTLQGAVYGFMGSLIASSIIVGTWLTFITTSQNQVFLQTIFKDLSLRQVFAPTTYEILILWLSPILVGTLLGIISGYFATKRHIK